MPILSHTQLHPLKYIDICDILNHLYFFILFNLFKRLKECIILDFRLVLLELDFMRLIIGSINYILIIPSINNWIWNIYVHFVILKKDLILTDILKDTFIWDLENAFNYFAIYNIFSIHYFVNVVLRYRPALPNLILDESFSYIELLILISWLIYK